MSKRFGVMLVGGVGITGMLLAAAERLTVFTAMLAFVSVIAICRGCSVRYYNRGYQLHMRKKYKEAFAYYSKAISVNPLLVRAYINRGVILTFTLKR